MIFDDLAGKKIVVTGANGGLGSAFTKIAKDSGAELLLIGRANPVPQKNSVVYESLSEGISWVSVDFSDEDSVKRGIREVRGIFPQIDGLVLAAGSAHGSLAQMTRLSDLRRVFEVNSISQFQLLQGLSRNFANPSSCVVVSSIASSYVQPGNSAYAASKAALERLVLGFAAEMSSKGVRFNTILPGPIATPMIEQMDPDSLRAMLASSFSPRAARPEDVANLIAFLISGVSAALNGAFLKLDGGLR